MAYLNANIPATYAQIRREYLYDLKKHHGEVEDCVIFGMSALEGRAILFHAIMDLKLPMYRNDDLMNFNFGIVLVIILLSLVGIF